ncbi:MAG TPA: hypothetical protein PLO53_09155, partial [Candidatus Hydrogenedentes bacterium]|nr:hypothetical protein [Candidatus Hydrogenedentota bacterium]
QAPSWFLNLCDKIGLCVVEEMPCFLWTDQNSPSHSSTLAYQDILGRHHHPSLCAWALTTDLDAIPPQDLGNTTEVSALALRKLDPTRLILVGHDRPKSQRIAVKPHQAAPIPFDMIRFHETSPLSRNAERFLRHAGGADTLNLAWIMCPGFASPEMPANSEAHQGLLLSFRGDEGPDSARKDLHQDTLCRAINALILNQKVSGYIVDPLTETPKRPGTGLLDGYGTPLPALNALEEIHAPLRPVIHLSQPNLIPRQECGVQVSTVNWAKEEDNAELMLQIVSPTSQVLWKKRRGLRFIPKHRQPLWEGTISASGTVGVHYLQVGILRNHLPPAESSCPFYVIPAPNRYEGRVHILDQQNRYADAIKRIASPGTLLSPIHIIAPFSNSLAGYPDNALAQVLAQVRGGAVALFFSPPSDWNELAGVTDIPEPGIPIRLNGRPEGDAALFCPVLHPVFDGLSGRKHVLYQLRNLLPSTVYQTESMEKILLCYLPTETPAGRKWTELHGIVVKRLGAGLITFIAMPLLDYVGLDPVADRIMVNLLSHFDRRSVPPDRPLPPESRIVEWIRDRAEQAMLPWRFIGPFPNWNGQGIHEPFPPEQELNFNGIYPGSHLPVMWQSHCIPAGGTLTLDFSEVIGNAEGDEDWHCFTAYAWAEIEAEKRCHATLEAGSVWPFRLWANDTEIISQPESSPDPTSPIWQRKEVTLRPGRNSLLIKAAKSAGPRLTVQLRLHAPESRKLAFLPPL